MCSCLCKRNKNSQPPKCIYAQHNERTYIGKAGDGRDLHRAVYGEHRAERDAPKLEEQERVRLWSRLGVFPGQLSHHKQNHGAQNAKPANPPKKWKPS